MDVTAPASTQQEALKTISEPLVNLIIQQTDSMRSDDGNARETGDILQETLDRWRIKQVLKHQKEQSLKTEAETVIASLP